MRQEIKSIGIDIGTSTTQLVFSRIVVENVAGSYNVPRVSIVDKEVIYRSKIYFTPLRSATEIDAEAVKKIVKDEYEAAGMTPADLSTGAVIITGETARKQNANEVLTLKRGTHHVCLGGVWIEAHIGTANIRIHNRESLPHQIWQA